MVAISAARMLAVLNAACFGGNIPFDRHLIECRSAWYQLGDDGDATTKVRSRIGRIGTGNSIADDAWLVADPSKS
jgi:hypothetical protein